MTWTRTACEEVDCDRPHHARGLCRKHYSRQRYHGLPPMAGSRRSPQGFDAVGAFWAKVTGRDDPEACWLWTGAQAFGGYGSLVRDGAATSPHRYAYTLLVGPIPDGLHIDHLCRVRLCCNPRHLEAVTQRVNNQRQAAVVTHCPQDHPYDEVNTFVTATGSRLCRACRRDRERVRQANIREARRVA